MKQYTSKISNLFLFGISLVLFYLYGVCPPAVNGSTAQNTSQTVVRPEVVVARVDDSEITKSQLERRMLAELVPDEYTDYNTQAAPADANSILMQMLGDKAIAIQARKDNYLNDPTVKYAFKRYSETALLNLFIQTYLEGKIDVNDSEITKKMQAEKGLDQAGAKAALMVEKANETINKHYEEIYTKLQVKKLSENYPAVLQAFKKLNETAQKRQTEKYILIEQVIEELTTQEKNTPLLTYDGGSITLQDWFLGLCEIPPPNRPNFTEKPELVEALLEKIESEQAPLFISEAKSLGLDKNQAYQQQMIAYEDIILLSKIQQQQYEKMEPPTQKELLAYFNANRELFRQGRLLKIEQIWTKDIQDARLAKAEIDKGQDFSAVAGKYSLIKGVSTDNVSISSEGLFWNSLWKNEKGQVIGPVKGFYDGEIKWRIVKILDKQPGKLSEYSADMNEAITNGIITKKLKSFFISYGKELLKKYPYQIYSDRIKDIDPLNIP
jgi:hypothetical protein